MSNDPTPSREPHALSVHRIDALTDGIYAVAMTLLVIDLKLPEHAEIHAAGDLGAALLGLLPKFIVWFMSFFVMAFFWMGHHRAHNHLRRADGRLVALNIGQLAFVSLMPFSCSLLGEHTGEHVGLLPQAIFALNMAALAVLAMLTARHIHRHPELAATPMLLGTYRGVQARTGGLIVVSALTVVIQSVVEAQPFGIGNIAFALMAVIMPLSRRVERASDRAVPGPAPG